MRKKILVAYGWQAKHINKEVDALRESIVDSLLPNFVTANYKNRTILNNGTYIDILCVSKENLSYKVDEIYIHSSVLELHEGVKTVQERLLPSLLPNGEVFTFTSHNEVYPFKYRVGESNE